MSELVSLIDEWKDAHGQPSDSSIARAIGIKPQTISSWRTRGIRELPDYETLVRLAEFMRLDYRRIVLQAGLRDIGYLREEVGDEPPEPTRDVAG